MPEPPSASARRRFHVRSNIATLGGEFGMGDANRHGTLLGTLSLQSGATLPASGAELEELRDSRSGAGQRHRLSDQLFSASHGPRAPDRTRRRAWTRRDGSSSFRTCSPTGCRQARPTTISTLHLVTTADNVRAQQRFLREVFGIERVACVYGFSMGAQQAYHWAALFPDQVERAIVVCGSARTSVHNQVFLRSLLATLEAAPEACRRRPLLGHARRKPCALSRGSMRAGR